ncbi:glutamate--cysteine ligase [Actinosynnema sp. NPDC047251]|uniref:Putative glutamate--cysteine ligase 2 n=1 Tax=Saccharothrix espanaensis (strain ATCC 51144 / DSM 44229 / JCM 9112 / NBRC 15066 / NRRL 15764) TaxID=1179773 RepID=K0K9Z8_SACES|nr:glutamate--cysteine ligase [Saccharothrix espanaensis]CCH33473.1 Glutamate-cysteine ligase GCS2 [Saccharothrix espanaensis DSM 44229]
MSEVDVSALPRPRTEFDPALSVGVEEEFLLVDAVTGALSPVAGEVLGDADGVLDLQSEMTRYQVESATAVCWSMDEVREQLVLSRRALGDLAKGHDARIVATGTPVLGGSRPPPLTDRQRYRDIEHRYGSLIDALTICGCHVHIGIPDEETGVLISNHLRQWLPVLLAISANSPFSEGRDTGYASWRYLSWSPWPSAGAPPWFASVEDYHLGTRTLRTSGAAMDTGMIYWDVRLSASHPTVELRVCDVAATVEEAVLIAAIARAIAVVAVSGAAAFPVSDLALRAALWRAARDGVEGAGVEPHTGRLVAAADLVRTLVEWIRPALRACGDEALVDDGVGRLLLDGCGATRQRRAFTRRGELADVVAMLVAQT